MKPQTAEWIYEARLGVERAKKAFTDCSTLTADECRTLCNGVERALKAPLIEQYGNIPKQYQHHKLVQICEVGGLWETLPPPLQSLVQTLDPYTPNVPYPGTPAFETLVAGKEDWGSRLNEAVQLVDHVERSLRGTTPACSPEAAQHDAG